MLDALYDKSQLVELFFREKKTFWCSYKKSDMRELGWKLEVFRTNVVFFLLSHARVRHYNVKVGSVYSEAIKSEEIGARKTPINTFREKLFTDRTSTRNPLDPYCVVELCAAGR